MGGRRGARARLCRHAGLGRRRRPARARIRSALTASSPLLACRAWSHVPAAEAWVQFSQGPDCLLRGLLEEQVRRLHAACGSVWLGAWPCLHGGAARAHLLRGWREQAGTAGGCWCSATAGWRALPSQPRPTKPAPPFPRPHLPQVGDLGGPRPCPGAPAPDEDEEEDAPAGQIIRWVPPVGTAPSFARVLRTGRAGGAPGVVQSSALPTRGGRAWEGLGWQDSTGCAAALLATRAGAA